MDYNLLRKDDIEKVEKEEKEKGHNEEKEKKEEEKNENSIDYSKPIKWNEINVDKLIYNSLEEIKFIANSIGIFQNGIKKHDLIDKIKSYIKINNEIIENKIKQDNNNPFNKNTFNSLEIPIGKDGEKELLFWKVFKNKSIFKTIMSHTRNHSTPHVQYDHIVSVESMLNNNQINILKEKVRFNRYLSFFSGSSFPEGNNEYYIPNTITKVWEKLFSIIQDDKEFYINLFKNYKDQIPFTEIDNKFKIIISLLLRTKCIPGLQVLIENKLFTPTFINLLDSIRDDDVELLKLFSQSISNGEIKKISKYEDISNYFPDWSDPNFLESMKYLMTFLEGDKKHINTLIPKLLYYIRFQKGDSLETFIKLIGYFDTFDYWEKFKELAIKFQFPWHLEVSLDGKDIDSLLDQFKNKMQTIQSLFSKDQLESSVYHPINYQSKQSEIISKLITIYFIVNNPTEDYFLEYYICYRGNIKVFKDFNIYGLTDYYSIDDDYLIEKIIFQHASCETFSKFYTPQHKYLIGKPLPLYSIFFRDESNILFNKCPNKESQIAFIDSFINGVKGKKHGLHPMFLLKLLVRNNDLELLNHFISNVDKSLLVEPKSIDTLSEISIFKNIKSIEMFIYLFNHLNHFTFTNYVVDLAHSKYLEKMAIEKNINLENNKITFSESAKLPVSFIKYVLENPTNYNIPRILNIRPIDYYENQEEYFNCLVNALKKDPKLIFNPQFYFKEINKSFTSSPSKGHCNLFKILDRSQSTLCFYFLFLGYDRQFMDYYFYNNMENNKLFQDNEITLLKLKTEYSRVITFSSVRVDLKILDRVLTICEKEYSKGNKDDQSIVKSIISSIIVVSIQEQQIFTLEYLLSNHGHIFKKKIESKSNTDDNNFRNGIFTLDELRGFVFLSLGAYNIRITNFLFSIVTITKTQLNNHSCPPIFYHFRDKLK
ncbi:hypothetical protein ACTA71_007211 [Dictyostelium dimigraforme]